MLVKEAMTENVTYIPSNTTLQEAAKRMHDMDCGFLPIGNSEDGKLLGVVTDRDITVRAIAEGKDPVTATVDEIKTEKVLYCFQDDNLADATESMQKEQVYRLIVLNNREDKKLCGIISLGDMVRHNEGDLVAQTAKSIAA